MRMMDTCARALRPAVVHALRRCARCPKTRRAILGRVTQTSLPITVMTTAALRRALAMHRMPPLVEELRVQAKPVVAPHAAALHVLLKPTAQALVLQPPALELLTLQLRVLPRHAVVMLVA